MTQILRTHFTEFRQVFSKKTPESRGAGFLLANTFATNIATALTSGVFYTAFMALNGIDIVRIGILGSIPSFCYLVSLLTPKIMERFRSRRWILFAAYMVRIFCTILGTTVMPIFVQDQTMRTVWFAVFLLVGNLTSALFDAGATAWQIHFIPKSDHLRNVYYSYHNLLGTLVTMVFNVFAAVIADALNGTPRELTVINIMRLSAFAIYVLAGVFAFLLPKEYPYEEKANRVRLLDSLRLPLKEKKFLLTASIIFFWNFMTACNSNTWTYYLKEAVGVSYFVMQLNSIIIVVANLTLLPWFRRLLERYSMPAMLRTGFFGIALCQFFVGFVAPGGAAYYAATMVPNGICWALINLCVANAFVYNLPEQNRDEHTVFWNLMLNVAMFLGSNFGAWFLAMLGDGIIFRFLGVDFYSSQVLMWFKFFANSCLALYVAKLTPLIRHT